MKIWYEKGGGANKAAAERINCSIKRINWEETFSASSDMYKSLPDGLKA